MLRSDTFLHKCIHAAGLNYLSARMDSDLEKYKEKPNADQEIISDRQKSIRVLNQCSNFIHELYEVAAISRQRNYDLERMNMELIRRVEVLQKENNELKKNIYER